MTKLRGKKRKKEVKKVHVEKKGCVTSPEVIFKDL